MTTATPLRRAQIVAVGTEMLGADRVDSNSLFITSLLNDLGIDVVAKVVVGDRLDDLIGVVGEALSRADLLVVTGGLGPTDDDLTRDAVAKALGRGMHEDVAITERIRARFAARGLPMPERNRRQAMVIEGAAILANTQGTAPGQWLEADGRVIVLLPGPPREMKPMCDAVARDVLAPRSAGEAVMRRTIRLVGRTESQADEMLEPLYRAWAGQTRPIDATILVAQAIIELQLRIRARVPADAEAALERAAQQVAETFGPDIISLTGASLEQAVGDLLRARGLRVAVAESCTGGLVTSRLTDVAGSSDYVDRSVVVYSNAAKTQLLGVPEALIAANGAVSDAVAAAMAEGVRRIAGVDVGLSVTGIAGPGGGTPAKPVGTVAIAVDGPGDYRFTRTSLFAGSREMIKTFSSTAALDRLRRAVLGV